MVFWKSVVAVDVVEHAEFVWEAGSVLARLLWVCRLDCKWPIQSCELLTKWKCQVVKPSCARQREARGVELWKTSTEELQQWYDGGTVEMSRKQ